VNLAAALLPFLPEGGSVAFVGAGGKTTALFRMGRELRALGRDPLLTATTHLAFPQDFDGTVVFRPGMEVPAGEADLPRPTGDPTLLVSREAPGGKVQGVHPAWIPRLARVWDGVLVEADGSRRLPLKAPGDHEPALPEGPCLVVGILGLGGLGRPLGEATVHRPERFAQVTGCAPGAPVEWAHLEALVRHPAGLFKCARGPRVLLLNQADRVDAIPGRDWAADLVLAGSLEAPEGGIVCLRRNACP
jgi:probable selenium-dependent hydroxylase accessory protein YqeC